ncbi:MAG TPA: hypothetical protein ENJ79_04150 [Gammaproteobacteria bacterium]|nr:hypothetical protein [Gammaproteobacteria bacterium]
MMPLEQALATGLPPLLRRLERRKLERLEAAFRLWWGQSDLNRPGEEDEELFEALILFLLHEVEETLEDIHYLRSQRVEFENRHAHAVTPGERQLHILDFAHALGADEKRLKGDRAAFSRWFGHDAVIDRFHRRHGEKEQHAAFCLDRTGALSQWLIGRAGDPELRLRLFRSLRLDARIEPLLAYDGDPRVRIKAFSCLAAALRGLPAEARERQVKPGVLQYIYRAALDARHDLWIQCEALALLQHLSLSSFERAARHRLQPGNHPDDLFVRRRVVGLVGNNLVRKPELAQLLEQAARDESPFVRQAVAQTLPELDAGSCLDLFTRLALEDKDRAVRAEALLQLPRLVSRDVLYTALLALTRDILESEQDIFVLRVALTRLVEAHAALEHAMARDWRAALVPVLAQLHRGAGSLAVRRWAARAREHLWCQSDPQRQSLYTRLAEWRDQTPRGRSKRLPRSLLKGTDEATLGRVLSLLAEDDFTLSLQRGVLSTRLHRDLRFGFRSWRVLHELRHPATDKRQGFRHSIGRIAYGSLRAPSAYMAEQTETRVPGEPLYMAEEDGWRPWLPLVDELISCLDESLRPGCIRFHTAEGVTELRPPERLADRLRARIRLTRDFAHYARLRNWREQDGGDAAGYVHAILELGFELRFHPHEDEAESADPSVLRFFPALLPVSLTDSGFWSGLRDYFFSVYENTLYELSLFLLLVSGYFFGRHLYVNRAIRQARSRLPLVIGGWGTRGKSGTERIKAALFNALGYSVVSKTTGTEAMFLHSYRYGDLGEMFLFRPYDKATIWEQANLVRLAERLDTDVFLWECMGLTPAYVRVLQQDWMRDDIATITNTYPDHEDLQGPAGINIPEVMTEFIPRHATLITSEEHMRPVLRADADIKGTTMKHCGWLEAGLITEDILSRFPYDEHPNNIALVLTLAEELGIERDFALKEMADRVVPDLGVLKTYPAAPMRGRVLEFTNGMAANERLGFMGNWERTGFSAEEASRTPGVWISTVINNREDRVPRSQVFADILARDIRADRHFLIGSNLHGFLNYLETSWKRFAHSYGLWPSTDGETREHPLQRFRHDAASMGIATDTETLRMRLEAALHRLGLEDDDARALALAPERLGSALREQGLEQYADALQAHADQWQGEYHRFLDLAQRIEAAGGQRDPDLEAEAAQCLWEWLQARLVVIDDVHASGNAIIERICTETPPGFHNRIMGCQNIKGPGLDFVYRWQAWETCQRACHQLGANDEVTAECGLRSLATFQEFGPLCEDTVRRTLAAVVHADTAQSEHFQRQLQLIGEALDKQLAAAQDARTGTAGTGWLHRLVTGIESFLDAGDAVRRRKRANRIYRDLADERISHARAVRELQNLNKRQKGGWLSQQIERWLERLRS